jgi:hypothetical protein
MSNVLIVYDNITVDNEFVRERLEDITNFYYNQPGWRVINTRNIDRTLRQISQTAGAEYVVVNALGHFLRHGSHTELVDVARSQSAPLVAHLIDRNGYYSFDSQYFCLNMAAYRQAGEPSLMPQPGLTFDSVVVDRSQEDFHDNYTPHWIAPGQGQTTYAPGVMEFGSNLVRALLEAGDRLVNIPQTIRDRKHYLYPDSNMTEIEAFFRDYNYQTDNIVLKKYFDAIRNYFLDEDRSIYLLSTEPVMTSAQTPAGFPSAEYNCVVGKIDTYVGVCGALKAIPILFNNGFDSNTKIHLIDVSSAALKYQQYLTQVWDGDINTYQQIVQNFRDQYPLDYIYCWKSWNSWQSEMDSFISGCRMTAEEFKTTWATYLKCQPEFHKVNLLNAQEFRNFAQSISYSGTSYTWVSNAFLMEHTTVAHGSEYMAERYYELVTVLKEQPGRVFIEKNNQLELLAGPRQG